MSERSLPRTDDIFSKAVTYSIGLHILVVLFFTVKITFFPSDDLLIRNAIKVDMVALPDKKVAPKKAPATKKKPVAKIKKPKKKPTKKNPKKTKSAQQDALKKLQQQLAIEEITKSLDDQKVAKPTEKPKPKEYRGNVITSGDSFSGLERLEFDEYFPAMKQHLQSNWELPQWLADANFKSKVQVTIDRLGVVTSKQIVTSSGNDIFDNTVLAAIDRSSPFPEPPDRLKGVLAGRAIIFSFPID